MNREKDGYTVTVLLDVNEIQDIDDRAEARTYLVADRRSGQALLIDSVLENVARDSRVVRRLGLTLRFVPCSRKGAIESVPLLDRIPTRSKPTVPCRRSSFLSCQTS